MQFKSISGLLLGICVANSATADLQYFYHDTNFEIDLLDAGSLLSSGSVFVDLPKESSVAGVPTGSRLVQIGLFGEGRLILDADVTTNEDAGGIYEYFVGTFVGAPGVEFGADSLDRGDEIFSQRSLPLLNLGEVANLSHASVNESLVMGYSFHADKDNLTPDSPMFMAGYDFSGSGQVAMEFAAQDAFVSLGGPYEFVSLNDFHLEVSLRVQYLYDVVPSPASGFVAGFGGLVLLRRNRK